MTVFYVIGVHEPNICLPRLLSSLAVCLYGTRSKKVGSLGTRLEDIYRRV